MTLQVARNRLPDHDLEENVLCGTLEPGVTSFVHDAFLHKMPSLIPFVQSSPSLLKLATHLKGVKQLYRVNDLKVELPYRLSKRVKFKDRSPTPEELQRLIDLGNPRERTIVSLLSLGGFRPGTLSLLEYRHVRKDLEKGIL